MAIMSPYDHPVMIKQHCYENSCSLFVAGDGNGNILRSQNSVSLGLGVVYPYLCKTVHEFSDTGFSCDTQARHGF